jgi:hypothetical protein
MKSNNGKALGKKPARSHLKMLLLKDFIPKTPEPPPKTYNYWKTKTGFPARSYGNRDVGDCTLASQANLATRMERVETRRTSSIITDEEVLRVYYDMTQRLYGGGDTGAYEVDALNCWRRADQTFRDQKGNPLTIDAFTSINIRDLDEVRYAIWLSGAKGIKLCLNLPLAYSHIDPPAIWPACPDSAPTGDWEPGSWGGHSLMADGYSTRGIELVHSWYDGDVKTDYKQTLAWEAFTIYCDEAYLVVDSIDGWRKKKTSLEVDKLESAVNDISSVKIK